MKIERILNYYAFLFDFSKVEHKDRQSMMDNSASLAQVER